MHGYILDIIIIIIIIIQGRKFSKYTHLRYMIVPPACMHAYYNIIAYIYFSYRWVSKIELKGYNNYTHPTVTLGPSANEHPVAIIIIIYAPQNTLAA